MKAGRGGGGRGGVCESEDKIRRHGEREAEKMEESHGNACWFVGGVNCILVYSLMHVMGNFLPVGFHIIMKGQVLLL